LLINIKKETEERIEEQEGATGLDQAEGEKILEALRPTLEAIPEDEVRLCEAQDLRNRAYEHLRRAIDDIREAARFVFRDQPSRLKRYPLLHSLGRSKRTRRPAQPAETATAVEQPTADMAVTAEIDSEPTQPGVSAMVH
jgi:hypothetical protein